MTERPQRELLLTWEEVVVMLEGYVYLIITIKETMTTVVHRHVFSYLDDCSE